MSKESREQVDHAIFGIDWGWCPICGGQTEMGPDFFEPMVCPSCERELAEDLYDDDDDDWDYDD